MGGEGNGELEGRERGEEGEGRGRGRGAPPLFASAPPVGCGWRRDW